MDEDGDGKTTEFEFLKFMLVTAGLADDSIMDALHARFTAMDTDGGGSLTRVSKLLHRLFLLDDILLPILIQISIYQCRRTSFLRIRKALNRSERMAMETTWSGMASCRW